METPKITDYSSWTYQLPKDPAQKDYEKLSSKLKTFVQSSKFLRQGSTVDEYDPQTGKRVKHPVTNVVYKETPESSEGLPAEELRQLIQQGVLAGDKKALEEASKYHYYSADRFVTQKQRQKEEDKKKRTRIILTSLAVGVPAGTALALIPFINARRHGDPITMGRIMDAGKMGLLGLAGGVATAGIIEGTRS